METTQVQDLRQSREYGEYIRKIDWIVEKVGGVNIFIRRLGWFGAIAKIQRVDVEDWTEINHVLKRYRVWMLKYEPLGMPKFRQDSWPMLATKTLRIDLRPSQQKILESFQKDARYCIRKCKMYNLECKINNFGGFYEMWRKANKIKNLWTPSLKHYMALVESFGDKCFCVTVNNIAGALILMHDNAAYYYYAGSMPEGKKLNLPYLVVWQCMQEAKKRGCKIWDFEGIYDHRFPNKSILGYTHFKKSFGGTELEYPGSFTKWF